MEEIELLNNAFEIYNLDNREDLSEQILDYIADRLLINKSNIIRLIEILEEKVTFSDIWNSFEQERSEKSHFKQTGIFRKIDSEFFMGIYATSKGNIVVETDDILEIIKYFVIAIKTRNTITISKLDYNEVSVESILLIIFCEALNKFGLDRNLIMIMPYEECYYENFDEVIISDSGIQKVEAKSATNKYIIYQYDSRFIEDIQKETEMLKSNDMDYEIVKGEFYQIVKEINNKKPIGASIYTSDPELGYRFINLIHSNNVFVNTTLLNSEKYEKSNNIYYLKKKIIYPMINYDNNQEKFEEIFNENETISQNVKSIEKEIKEESKDLIIQNVNPWYKKIFELVKNFFKK